MPFILPTSKTTGKPTINSIRFLLYGKPKIGKTHICAGFPDTLFLATEKGYGAQTIYKVDIEKWEDFEEAIKLILKGTHKFKFIIIDTLDELLKLCEQYVCKKLDVDHISDATHGKGYDKFRTFFDAAINPLFMSKYGLIFTSHTKEMEIRDGNSSSILTTLSIKQFHRGSIIPKVNSVGYVRIKTIKLSKGYSKIRVISFAPSIHEEAGDRDGALTEIESHKDATKTFKEFENAYRLLGEK